MARQYLTGLNLNKNELLNARIQNLAIAPLNPVIGQIYYDTAVGTLRQWNGTKWLSFVSSNGGDQYITSVGTNLAVDAGALSLGAKVVITDAIQTLTNKTLGANTDLDGNLDAASNKIINLGAPTLDGDASTKKYVDDEINLLSTADIEEDSTHLYFTDNRAKDAAGALLEAASVSNITFVYDEVTHLLTVTAENGVADSDTDDLVEGTTNLYFTAARALAATAAAYDPAGAAATALTDANAHTDGEIITALTTADGYVDTHSALTTGVHGVIGTVVGTSDSQTLTNKILGASSSLGANLDADGFKITNVGTPTADGDAANKAYVDNAVSGLTWKASVNLLADVNVALTGDTDTLVIDSHSALDTTHVGYRILLTAQSTDSENGIYVYADTGTTYTLSRATDADVYTELVNATVFIQEGTVYGQSAWTQSNHYLTDFTSQDWVQFSGAAQIVAGDGLTKLGNTLDVVGTADRITANADSIDIASTYVGQSSITTLGTITTGVWNGTDIAVADGGTGASTATAARANLGATTKFAESNAELTVTSGSVTWVATHSLGTSDVTVQLRDLATNALVEVDVTITNSNVVTLSWVAAATVAANSYRVVIVG